MDAVNATPAGSEEHRRRGPRITGMYLAIDIGISLALWGLLWLAVTRLAAIWP